MWANCLRDLPDDGITVAGLRRLARTWTNLDGMRRWGYVTFSPDPGRGRPPRDDAVMRPTARGRQVREAWREAVDACERRWRDRFGPDAVGALRSALAAVVADLDPALPELPLWALLSKPLLAFATDFERESVTSLAIGANVLRVLTAEGVRARDVPALAGVSKESIAMAAGFLRKRGLVIEEPDPSAARGKVIRLTDVGLAARHHHHALVDMVEARWRTRFSPDAVAALRMSLEPLALGDPPPLFACLAPYPDGWRARIRPPRTLPHYPMTLHRGAYPDGS